MRTFDEIQADISQASSISDAAALRDLASEMQALGTREAEASAFRALGTVSVFAGDYAQALEHYGRGLAVHKELGDRAGVARTTGNIGLVHTRTGDYPLALEHCRRALQVHEELGDRAGVANINGNTGAVYSNTGDYPQALEHYHRAQAIHEELGNRATAARISGNIGNVYLNTGDYPEALQHYVRALDVLEELGDRTIAAVVTGNMGNVYRRTGDYAEALEHYRRALAMHEELGDRTGVGRVTGNIASVLLILERYDEAAELLRRQTDLQKVSPDVRAWHCSNCATLAEHQEDLDAARRHLTEALAITTEAGLRAESAMYHEKLRDLAQKRNDFAGYIEHNNEYQRISEDVSGKESTQRMTMIEADRKIEAELRERDKERALLYGALPEHIATRMLRGETIEDHIDTAAVLFADIAGFTTHSSSMHPSETIKLLDQIFNHFDAICAEHGVTKVKTIGDSYLCFAGSDIGERISDIGPEERIAAVALAMQNAEFTWPSANSQQQQPTVTANSNRVQFRIGMHCGPVTAGVIGTQRLQYDVWGDTVNVASRMESTGEPGRIQVSSAFADQLRLQLAVAEEEGTANSNSQQQLRERGSIDVKGKGSMTTYWLEGA